MAYELWATYSVKDHLKPRRLAAELMQFDRLVFPVPEQENFPLDGGSLIDIGPVEWVRDETEWTRWEREAWEPAAQQQLLEYWVPRSGKCRGRTPAWWASAIAPRRRGSPE